MHIPELDAYLAEQDPPMWFQRQESTEYAPPDYIRITPKKGRWLVVRLVDIKWVRPARISLDSGDYITVELAESERIAALLTGEGSDGG